jgi:hypothetical protein
MGGFIIGAERMGVDGWLVRSVLGLDGVDGGHRAGNKLWFLPSPVLVKDGKIW